MLISDFNKIDGLIKVIGKLDISKVNISTDSRNPKASNVFVALKGDRFDAYDFIDDAIANGFTTIVVTNSAERQRDLATKKTSGITYLFVDDSLTFLQRSANYRIREWKKLGGVCFGLTGSNAKTTTKELINKLAVSFLHEDVICTSGNLNNHIGVPLTIFTIEDHHKFAIIEMGTNNFGEIETLCKIAEPDYGFITNIGYAHTEFLIDLDGVLKEKSALYSWIIEHGKRFYLNIDDSKLTKLKRGAKVTQLSKTLVKDLNNKNLLEDFNRWNAQAAQFILEDMFKRDLSNEMPNLSLPKNKRAQWVVVGNSKIYLDAYNANPTSMLLSLEEFSKQVSKEFSSIYILGDMNELGSSAKFHHEQVSNKMNELAISKAIFIGKYSKFYEDSFCGESQSYENLDDFKQNWNEVLKSYNYVFLKASRSLQLERLLDIT